MADIIVDHKTEPAKYRLDDTISRQEVIGMSLKLRGVALPANYACKGYFSDATFDKNAADAWVCRAVELAADRGIVTRDNTTTRPSANISRVEALALLWKSAGMITDTASSDEGTFYDTAGNPANTWQENLLQSARIAGIISPTETGTGATKKLLWCHNDSATRKEVFAMISVLQTLKQANDQMPYLVFSGEVQYKPGTTHIMSTDPTLITNLQNKDFDKAVAAMTPVPVEYRTEGNTLFIMQKYPDKW